jgi:hypothetical protein
MTPMAFAALLDPLGHGERLVAFRIFRTLTRRLAMGQRQYGLLDPINDPRDWVKEAHEELVDGMVYAECDLIRSEAFARTSPAELAAYYEDDADTLPRMVAANDVMAETG